MASLLEEGRYSSWVRPKPLHHLNCQHSQTSCRSGAALLQCCCEKCTELQIYQMRSLAALLQQLLQVAWVGCQLGSASPLILQRSFYLPSFCFYEHTSTLQPLSMPRWCVHRSFHASAVTKLFMQALQGYRTLQHPRAIYSESRLHIRLSC